MGVYDNQMTENSSYADFDPDLAMIQQANLRTALRDLGATIILDDGHKDHFDGVYNADPTLSMMHLTIDKGEIIGADFDIVASNFYNFSRQGEVDRQIGSINFLKRYLMQKFSLQTTTSIEHSSICGEGTGDNVYDPHRDIFFAGFKPKSGVFAPTLGRSDPNFHKVIEAKMNMPGRTFPFEVQNGYFHSDTIVGPMQKGDIVVYPGGMSVDDFEKLKKLTEAEKRTLITVSREDALNYAPNLVLMNANEIITAQTSQAISKAIESAGYQHTQIDLSQYVKQSGGGAHCLTNRINQMRRDEYQRALELLSPHNS